MNTNNTYFENKPLFQIYLDQNQPNDFYLYPIDIDFHEYYILVFIMYVVYIYMFL